MAAQVSLGCLAALARPLALLHWRRRDTPLEHRRPALACLQAVLALQAPLRMQRHQRLRLTRSAAGLHRRWSASRRRRPDRVRSAMQQEALHHARLRSRGLLRV